jgi:hypothetical protein
MADNILLKNIRHDLAIGQHRYDCINARHRLTHIRISLAAIGFGLNERRFGQIEGIHFMPGLNEIGRHPAAHIAEADKCDFHVAYPIVGITNALPPSGEPSGQRWVMVLTLVQNLTPSMPCWLVSPNAERFQPPKL